MWDGILQAAAGRKGRLGCERSERKKKAKPLAD